MRNLNKKVLIGFILLLGIFSNFGSIRANSCGGSLVVADTYTETVLLYGNDNYFVEMTEDQVCNLVLTCDQNNEIDVFFYSTVGECTGAGSYKNTTNGNLEHSFTATTAGIYHFRASTPQATTAYTMVISFPTALIPGYELFTIISIIAASIVILIRRKHIN